MPVTINGTTGIQNVLGSASAPAESNTSSSNTGLYFPTSTTLGLSTAGTNALYVDASQNVGIGTTSPAALLHVNGSGPSLRVSDSVGTGVAQLNTRNSTANSTWGVDNSVGGITGTANAAYWYNSANTPSVFFTNATERMRIDSSGNLLVGTTSSPSNARFRAYGNASADFNFGPQTTSGNNAFVVYNQSNVGVYIPSGNNSWTSTSDETLKNITGTIQNGLEKVNTLRAAEFTWKADEKNTPQVGLIAQDVQKVLPEVVDINSEGHLGIRYTEVVSLLVAALQELDAKFEAYKASHP